MNSSPNPPNPTSGTNETKEPELHTDRLYIRRMMLTELKSFLRYRNDPEVAKYQGWEPNLTEEYGHNFIASIQQAQLGKDNQWIQLAVFLKQSELHIGDLAFKLNDKCRQTEIGFTFDRKYQKKGYAREAVRSLLDYFFEKLHLHRVVAITDDKNQASWKLLEKLGFRKEAHYIQNIYFKGSWGNEFLYAIL